GPRRRGVLLARDAGQLAQPFARLAAAFVPAVRGALPGDLHLAGEEDEGHGRALGGLAHGELHAVQAPAFGGPLVERALEGAFVHGGQLHDLVAELAGEGRRRGLLPPPRRPGGEAWSTSGWWTASSSCARRRRHFAG